MSSASEPTIDVTREPPAGARTFSEVYGEEYEPKRLVDLSCALAEHRRLQGIEEVAGGVGPETADVTCPNHRDVFNTPYAFNELLEESMAIGTIAEAR
jgi:hypothetical protein